ncbi:hypothetical protein P3S68_025073 [Capsicum galapagoense]
MSTVTSTAAANGYSTYFPTPFHLQQQPYIVLLLRRLLLLFIQLRQLFPGFILSLNINKHINYLKELPNNYA